MVIKNSTPCEKRNDRAESRMDMKHYFVNFTNHPSAGWEEHQIQEALKYGEILDLPFPTVDPQGDEDDIRRLSEECAGQILTLCPGAVLCQGEFNVVYQVVNRLLEQGVTVLAACSARMVEETDGKKVVTYQFCRFRKYER